MGKAWDLSGKATGELLGEAEALLGRLRKLVEGRRNKDAAFVAVTDSYLIFQAIGERLQDMEFASGPVNIEEEDEMPERADAAALADLFATPDHETASRVEFLQRGMCEVCAGHAEELQGLMREVTDALDGGDDAALGRLGHLQKPLASLQRIDPSSARLQELYDAAYYALEEFSREAQAYADGVEHMYPRFGGNFNKFFKPNSKRRVDGDGVNFDCIVGNSNSARWRW